MDIAAAAEAKIAAATRHDIDQTIDIELATELVSDEIPLYLLSSLKMIT